MKQQITNLLKLLIVVAVGFGIFKFMNSNPKVAEHLPDSLPPKSVRVIEVAESPFTANVRAYGSIQPATEFESRAELSAKVSFVHPELKEGGSIAAGTVVIRLDPGDFERSLSQTQSDLSVSQSALAQVDLEEKNTRASLNLAQKNLTLGESELARVKLLLDKQLIARSTLDAEQQKVNQLRQTVSDLEGRLTTFATQKASAGAQIDRSSQQVESQKTTLGRTEIAMPFDARISQVNVTNGEFVSVGNSLFQAIDIAGVEVRADLPIRVMRKLISAFDGRTINFDAEQVSNVVKSLQLKAELNLSEAGEDATWSGKVVRISESIDPQRRTIGLTVAVEDPYVGVVVGTKPPLIKGMYVSIDISAPPYMAITIPRNAVHQGRVYLVDENNNLELRPIKIRATQGNTIVVAEGLGAGDRVIIDDLIPVIAGMPLQAQLVATAEQQ